MSAHRSQHCLLQIGPARRLPSDTPAQSKGVKALGRAGASEYSLPPPLSWRLKNRQDEVRPHTQTPPIVPSPAPFQQKEVNH